MGDARASVTVWLRRLSDGDPAAAQPLWERYYRRLVGLARAALKDAPRRAADEEDVALGAFDSFCRGVEAGRFPRLHDRHNLWALLVTLTERHAHELRLHEGRQKRGGGMERAGAACDELASPEPTPSFAAAMAEACERLLDRLRDPELRRIAVMKLEGWTNDEITGQVGCVRTTVERRLRLIRSMWEKEIAR
jgi:DNA-directed RNA polymerase specialized sigma24 family protein